MKLGYGTNGRKVIFNESSAQYSRRSAAKLVPVPDGELEPLILRHSGAQNLDPKLVKALIQVESGYNSRALSNKGAMGLMQLMPGTASSLRVQNPYDPDENLRGGTTYFRRMLDRFAGRLELAVAAYNAGPAPSSATAASPLRETRAYVERVLCCTRERRRPAARGRRLQLREPRRRLQRRPAPQAVPDPQRAEPPGPHDLPRRGPLKSSCRPLGPTVA